MHSTRRCSPLQALATKPRTLATIATLLLSATTLLACGGGGSSDPDARVQSASDGGNIIADDCGDLTEGRGACVNSEDLYVCEEDQLVAYVCPAGSACFADASESLGVACFCDDIADGLCPDAVCTDDPDCAPSIDAGPDCEPVSLPGAATNIMPAPSGRLPVPGRLAVSGSQLFATVHYGGESRTASRIVSCPTSGCSTTPTAFGNPSLLSGDIGLAVAGTKVYWTERDSESGGSSVYDANILKSADLSGANETTVHWEQSFGGIAAIGADIGTSGDTVFFDATNGLEPDTAGLRRSVAGATSTAVAGGTHAVYGSGSVFSGGGLILHWFDPLSFNQGDEEIDLYNEAGVSQGVLKSGRTPLSGGLATDGTYVAYRESANSSYTYYMCEASDCATPMDIGALYNMRGFTIAIANSRLYFAAAVDQGCGEGFTGVLASCGLSEALDGTCTPTYHATGFHWINVKYLVVTGSAAFATSKTSQELMKVDLTSSVNQTASSPRLHPTRVRRRVKR